MLNTRKLRKESIINPIGFFDWATKDLGFSTKDTIKIIEDYKYVKIFEILTKKYRARKQRKLTKTNHNKLGSSCINGTNPSPNFIEPKLTNNNFSSGNL